MPTLFPENQTNSLLITNFVIETTTSSITKTINQSETNSDNEYSDNWWALLTLILVIATAAGNILVCLAISWEKRLQNVTNYFLMSLAVTDLMVAILVMPLGILTLFKGYFPLESIYCLLWICLDVLFCTASIMHLCTISVDRYLSLRYPMKFGRNKTRRRVVLKIIFVWILSIAMSLPLCLMYSQNRESVLINGSCQIPDPLYKLIGSIICFYIPLLVMLGTYMLTVQLLAQQQKSLGGRYEKQSNHWFLNTSNWFPSIVQSSFERHKQVQKPNSYGDQSGIESASTISSTAITPRKTTGTIKSISEVSTTSSTDNQKVESDEIDTMYETEELWLDDYKEDNSTVMMSALQQFGAQMLQLSRGLQDVESTGSIRQNDISISKSANNVAADKTLSPITQTTNTERFPNRRTFSVYENKTNSEIIRKKLQISKSVISNEEIELKSIKQSPVQMIVKSDEKTRQILSLKKQKSPKITTSLLSENSIKNSSRHGRILLLEQKATKVLGIVFFTFVILWAPFFVLNLLPILCEHCEQKLSHIVFDFVTWLGYASSMINPIFYTIFNKIFRQTFVKVIRCHYCRHSKQSKMRHVPNSFKTPRNNNFDKIV